MNGYQAGGRISGFIKKLFTLQNIVVSKESRFKVFTQDFTFKISNPEVFIFPALCKRQSEFGKETSQIHHESENISSSLNVVTIETRNQYPPNSLVFKE